MFEVSTNWLNGAGQVAVYALLITKIEIKEGEGKK